MDKVPGGAQAGYGGAARESGSEYESGPVFVPLVDAATAAVAASAPEPTPAASGAGDAVALARLYGEPLYALPADLYIPPGALEVLLGAFEGPLDLLLYLIRRQNFDILDIPLADVTRQYLAYIEQLRC
jgi:segregation and condensation protein A